MQSEKTVTVSGKSYVIHHMIPSVALKNYLKLQKYILGPIGEALGSMGMTSIKESASSLMDTNIDIGAALSKLGDSLKPEEMTDLFKELILLGARDEKGMEINFEQEFMGDIGQVFSLVKEVVSHNYPNFFGALFDLAGLGKPKVTTPAK